jgi:uncharacterized protein (DUF4415 family)
VSAEYDFAKSKSRAIIPQKGKTWISILIDNRVLDEFRARAKNAGMGYQTMVNEVLRQCFSTTGQPVTEEILRPVPRK